MPKNACNSHVTHICLVTAYLSQSKHTRCEWRPPHTPRLSKQSTICHPSIYKVDCHYQYIITCFSQLIAHFRSNAAAAQQQQLLIAPHQMLP